MTQPQKEKIEVDVNQMFDISLESMMGSTGYGWELSKLEGPVNLCGISIVPSTTAEIAPVKQIFHFRGVGEGKASVELVLTAPWKIEDPIQTVIYQITVNKAKPVSADDLKLKGFVAAPKTDVREAAAEPNSLYNIYPPTQDYGVLTANILQRLYYGILPPIDPRFYYGVLCAPEKMTTADPRLYYGVCCAPEASVAADPRLYYGVCCAPNANVAADPRLYYGVCCDPSVSAANARLYYGVCCKPDINTNLSAPQVFKYGILPLPPYGVYPVYNVQPTLKYGIPPMMRYNYPSGNTECC